MKPTQIDLMLQAHAPIETVPMYGVFESMNKVGHRFLLARDGLWLEVRRPWVHVLWPIAQTRKVSIPAGELKKTVDLRFKKAPGDLLRQFIDMSVDASPNEIGAIVTWHEESQEFALVGTRTLKSGIGHLTYVRPDVGDGEHVVMDLHSHGPINAYFSKTDVADTGAEVVIAAVVGGIGGAVEVKVSLFACGIQIPVDWPEAGKNASEKGLEGAWAKG